jgi:type IV secretory pathway VirB4 component
MTKINYQFDFGRLEDLNHELARISSLKDRYRHTFVLGTTGTGKTTVLLRLARYDANKGLGVIFIDPKGDHALQLFRMVKDKSRITYISYNNPIVTINPLRKDGYRLEQLVDEFIEILDILIKRTSPANPPATPAMKEIIRNTVMALKPEDRNVDYIYRFLLNDKEREKYFREDRPEFWVTFDKRDKFGRPTYPYYDTAARIASRLSKFDQDPNLKKIVSGPNTLDIHEIARKGRILIVDVSSMSKEARVYLTSLITFAIKSYVEFQKQDKYYPLMFYLDEAWMGINESFDYLLSFGRSFKTSFNLATQSVHQFESLKEIKLIMGLCNTKVALLAAGDDEAKVLASVYGLPATAFIGLDRYQAWVRIFNRNSLVTTYPLPKIMSNEIPQSSEKELMNRVEGPMNQEVGNRVRLLRDCWFSC